MKRFRNLLAILIATASVAVTAAETPVQKTQSATLGSITYTQEQDYVVYDLTKIELFNTQPASATAVVRRVSGTLTNTIGSIVTTNGYGSLVVSEPLFKGDLLVTTAAGTNTASQRTTGDEKP